MDGVLIVRKPRGITSFGVVARLRRQLAVRRIGHAGTLDPMAEGVLVVALGEGTKLVPYMTAHDKVYLAEIELGHETTTLDAEGDITRAEPVPEMVLRALDASSGSPLDAALYRERTRTEQVPPNVSAIHVQGKRAYELARRGVQMELAPRPVVVHEITLERSESTPRPRAWFRLRVGAGYYVRAFARDLAYSMHTFGTLTALTRVASGAFTLDETTPLDAPEPDLRAKILSLEDIATRTLPKIVLDDAEAAHARAGRPFPSSSPEGVPHAWFDAAGTLLAIGAKDAEGYARVLRGFVAGAKA